jgi:hypothetical protein
VCGGAGCGGAPLCPLPARSWPSEPPLRYAARSPASTRPGGALAGANSPVDLTQSDRSQPAVSSRPSAPCRRVQILIQPESGPSQQGLLYRSQDPQQWNRTLLGTADFSLQNRMGAGSPPPRTALRMHLQQPQHMPGHRLTPQGAHARIDLGVKIRMGGCDRAGGAGRCF